jgi:hypothetical protein
MSDMSVALTLGTEFVVAKTVDYSMATVARQKGSPAEAFFANMAREGLRAGWEKTGEMLPWWYGALSSGATGTTDFVAGSVIAGLLRSQFDAVLDKHPDLKDIVGTPKFDDVVAALRGQSIPGLSDDGAAALKTIVNAMVDGDGDAALLKRLIEGAPGVELKSPVARHLQKALGESPGDSAMAGFVKRNLLSKDNAASSAIGGTVAGYALKGAVTGAAFGHADVGAAVTLLDSLSEGLLAQKAMKGDYRALTAIKSQLLLQGFDEAKHAPDWKAAVNNRLLGLYSQMGEEVRLLGQDLGHLAAAGEVVLDKGLVDVAARVGAETASAAVDGARAIGAAPPPPSVSSTANGRGYAHVGGAAGDLVKDAAMAAGAVQGAHAARSVASVMRAQVQAARSELHHHANVDMREVLAADFARERETVTALANRVQEQARERLLELQVEYPNLARVLASSSQRTPPEALQRWAHNARVTAEHVAHSGLATAGVVVDGASKAVTTVLDSELGQAILQLAERVGLAFQVELVMGAEAVRDAAQQGAFATMSVVGGVAVAGLLAGERYVRDHAQTIAPHVQRANDAHGKVLGAAHAAVQTIGQSASRGATELGTLISKVMHALDAAVGRVAGG